jgi:molybdopterin synthase catalytic subunit
MVSITDQSIDIGALQRSVEDDGAGGTVLFIGTTRDVTDGRKVVALEFEAYKPMALRELEKIVQYARKHWQVRHISVTHAVGRLAVGDPAVVVAVSAPHRDAAFEACRYIIDTLKKTVPIWKKEIFSDGEVWVNAHP